LQLIRGSETVQKSCRRW